MSFSELYGVNRSLRYALWCGGCIDHGVYGRMSIVFLISARRCE